MTTMFEGDTTTKTAPSELDTFKALVRRKAQSAKRQQGWETAKMNAVLVELGVEPVASYSIEVPFTATGTYRISLDGYSERDVETALTNTAAMTDADLLRNVRSSDMKMTERATPQKVVAGVEGAETAEEAKTTDLDAYKRFVRRVSIRTAKDNGWCDSGLNEYLEAMGLPLKQNHYVVVEAPLTQRVQVLVGDAESAEEARRLVSEGGDYAERLVREQLGTTVTLTGKPIVPDPNELLEKAQAGDRPDPTYNNTTGHPSPACHQYNAHRTSYCTRERGHSGQHVAGSDTRVVDVWKEGEGTR